MPTRRVGPFPATAVAPDGTAEARLLRSGFRAHPAALDADGARLDLAPRAGVVFVVAWGFLTAIATRTIPASGRKQLRITLPKR